MEKLTFTTFDISEGDYVFNTTLGYTEPQSEGERRKQLSYPIGQIKSFINQTVTEDENGKAVQLRVNSGKLQYRVSGNVWTDVSGGIPSGGTSGQVIEKSSSTDYDVAWKDRTLDVLTTAPESAYTGGGVKIVYLASEPATKYSGYIYLIKES